MPNIVPIIYMILMYRYILWLERPVVQDSELNCQLACRLTGLEGPVMVKMGPPKLVLPGTYFTALKNLDHLTQMKNVDPEPISLTKFGPVAYLGTLLRFLETIQARKFSSTQCTSFVPYAAFNCT